MICCVHHSICPCHGKNEVCQYTMDMNDGASAFGSEENEMVDCTKNHLENHGHSNTKAEQDVSPNNAVLHGVSCRPVQRWSVLTETEPQC
jgi:hypothetical protein